MITSICGAYRVGAFVAFHSGIGLSLVVGGAESSADPNTVCLFPVKGVGLECGMVLGSPTVRLSDCTMLLYIASQYYAQGWSFLASP